MFLPGLVRVSQSPRFVRTGLLLLLLLGVCALLSRQNLRYGRNVEEDIDADIQHLLAATDKQLWPIHDAPGSGDALNYFEAYKQNATCTVDSRQLYTPSTKPQCSNAAELLQSLTYGRRVSQDGPFHPYGCNLNFYTPAEVCDIMSRFDKVWIVGDSLMRHVASALHIILRQDLIEGAFASWAARDREQSYIHEKQVALKAGRPPPPPPLLDCRCDAAFSNGSCLFLEAWSSASIRRFDPDSITCDQAHCAGIELITAKDYPIEKGTLDRLTSALADSKPPNAAPGARGRPTKRHAVIMGSGLWYDLEVDKFQRWVIEIQRAVLTTLDDVYGSFEVPRVPMLAVTPSAGGPLKPHKYVDKQSNRRIKTFEMQFAKWLAYRQARGFPGATVNHLGTYNATILNSSPDGTHSGMKADLLKALIVLNWLDLVSR